MDISEGQKSEVFKCVCSLIPEWKDYTEQEIVI